MTSNSLSAVEKKIEELIGITPDASVHNAGLADVLRAIGNMLVVIDCWGNFYQLKMKMSDKVPSFDKDAGTAKWDLTKPLSGQSEECLCFLASLLGK